ncbi:MAG: PspC domain-containing protein, partial [Actinomycetota bacterium]|nr:PspC domain-containing protein [Actinomycetota bacterium]
MSADKMTEAMATSSATPATPTPRPLRRDPANGLFGGVCAGLARRLEVDPLLVRVGFLAAALAGGLGLILYPLCWVAIPAGEGDAAAAGQRRSGRGAVEVGIGVGLLLLSVLLAFREVGLWFSDVLVWPLVLVAAGGALIWRQSLGGPAPTAAERSSPGTAAVAPTGRSSPKPVVEPPALPDDARQRVGVVSRTGLGVALVIAAGLAFLQATGALSAARDVLLAALVVAVALGVIFAPWILRLARSLAAERSERIRSQERAEVAAHLHDSVLQTLALVQKQAGDPRQVAALARRQERELRSWLSGRPLTGDVPQGVTAALEAAAEEVEREYGATVDVVAVGDRELGASGEALVAAAREAMVNAAKFGADSPVAVYAEASESRTAVFVRDRGPGFDPAAVPPDRRGVRESIVGQMERHGGRARVKSSAGAGTEVELVL